MENKAAKITFRVYTTLVILAMIAGIFFPDTDIGKWLNKPGPETYTAEY